LPRLPSKQFDLANILQKKSSDKFSIFFLSKGKSTFVEYDEELIEG
jgi:hypothetical protein